LSAGVEPSGLMRMILPRSLAGVLRFRTQHFAIAVGDKQRAAGRPRQPRAEMIGTVGGGQLLEDELHLF
jgi:hypothetical protein